jgi:hypothetical protein
VRYRGGLSSPASQPTASVFIGSTGKETFVIIWQVLHTKVRNSKPRLPAEIWAKPILCLHVKHHGRAVIRITKQPTLIPHQ